MLGSIGDGLGELCIGAAGGVWNVGARIGVVGQVPAGQARRCRERKGGIGQARQAWRVLERNGEVCQGRRGR